MSLNDVRLNARLLTQLYPHSLLEIKEKAPAPPPAGMGENQKNAPNTPTRNTSQPQPPTVQAPAAADVATIEAPAPTVAMGNTPYLGGNKRGVLLLVSHADVSFLPDAELGFLSAILSACRLSIADVAIVNLHHYPQPYTGLLEQLGSRQVLLLGVSPQVIDLPFHFPHFQLQPFDGRTYLSAYPLGQMAQDRELKTQLWACLKRMFGV